MLFTNAALWPTSELGWLPFIDKVLHPFVTKRMKMKKWMNRKWLRRRHLISGHTYFYNNLIHALNSSLHVLFAEWVLQNKQSYPPLKPRQYFQVVEGCPDELDSKFFELQEKFMKFFSWNYDLVRSVRTFGKNPNIFEKRTMLISTETNNFFDIIRRFITMNDGGMIVTMRQRRMFKFRRTLLPEKYY